MKRRYELNLYTPDQYNDLQEHLGHMASRGWMLERMEQHFLVYRQNVSSPVHYAVAFHPEVGDMDSLRTPALEFYEAAGGHLEQISSDPGIRHPAAGPGPSPNGSGYTLGGDGGLDGKTLLAQSAG